MDFDLDGFLDASARVSRDLSILDTRADVYAMAWVTRRGMRAAERVGSERAGVVDSDRVVLAEDRDFLEVAA